MKGTTRRAKAVYDLCFCARNVYSKILETNVQRCEGTCSLVNDENVAFGRDKYIVCFLPN